jgi:hypothetical protein
MKKEDFEELIGLYLSGEVPPGDKEKIREDLIAEGYPVNELDALDKLNSNLSRMPSGTPSEKMDRKFYKWLGSRENETVTHKFMSRISGFVKGPGGRIAAGIALFILGWLCSSILGTGSGKQYESSLSAEILDLQQSLFLTRMQQTSSVDRIQAVNMLDEMDEVNDRIIESLLTVLVMDQNNNVRLASLESLLPYVDSPIVREGLIRSIDKQNSPLVQLRLAEVMMKIQVPEAIPEIRKVLNRANLNYSVRTKYDETLQKLASL